MAYLEVNDSDDVARFTNNRSEKQLLKNTFLIKNSNSVEIGIREIESSSNSGKVGDSLQHTKSLAVFEKYDQNENGSDAVNFLLPDPDNQSKTYSDRMTQLHQSYKVLPRIEETSSQNSLTSIDSENCNSDFT